MRMRVGLLRPWLRLQRQGCGLKGAHDQCRFYHVWLESSEGAVRLVDVAHSPVLRYPHSVLVRVHAFALNPIDVMMAKGYGDNVIRGLTSLSNKNNIVDKDKTTTATTLGHLESRVLGRDFSGVVVAKGTKSDFRIGDEVFGSLSPLELHGSFSQLLPINSISLIRRKPKALKHHEAAALPYAFTTAYSALSVTANMSMRKAEHAKVLLIGAAGGVGHLALQLLKTLNTHVIATCSSDATALVTDCGADVVLDYRAEDHLSLLENEAPFDLVLDCSTHSSDSKRLRSTLLASQYISLSSPLIARTDQQGLTLGLLASLYELVAANCDSKANFKWAFFMPLPKAMDHLVQLVENEEIHPYIDSVFPFEGVPQAMQRVERGSLRGKVVVTLN